jgi:hypothetical protein
MTKLCKTGDLDRAAWHLRICRRCRTKTGAVQGTVFTTDADGGRSVVPGAKVSLNGPTLSGTSADAEGKFVFSVLQPGVLHPQIRSFRNDRDTSSGGGCRSGCRRYRRNVLHVWKML